MGAYSPQTPCASWPGSRKKPRDPIQEVRKSNQPVTDALQWYGEK